MIITKNTLHTLVASATLVLCSPTANGALVNGSILNVGADSYLYMEIAPGFYLPGPIAAVGTGGIITGSAQSPGDIGVWNWTGNLGYDHTASPADVLSASGSSATLDMSGWSVAFLGLVIDAGSGAWNDAANGWTGNVDGVGQITCAVDCGDGDSYVLQYTATIPDGDPSGFGNVHFGWRIQGTVSAVPIPAAAWLFGSGLLMLIGSSKRNELR